MRVPRVRATVAARREGNPHAGGDSEEGLRVDAVALQDVVVGVVVAAEGIITCTAAAG